MQFYFDKPHNPQTYNYTFQLCTGGSVTDLVQGLRSRGAQLSEKQISYILRETIQALIYLHENHCMHRDIKGKKKNNAARQRYI